MPKMKRKGKRIGSMLHDALFYDRRIETLSLSGFKLLVELNQQYSSFNNGNLCAALGSLRFKWNDKTLKKARRELVNGGFIEVTRIGVKKRPTLYALCHLPINEIAKHNIKERQACSRRATGKREYYYPVKRNLQAEVAAALENAQKKKDIQNVSMS